MNIFDEIEALYLESDNRYSMAEFQARAKGYSKKEALFSRKKRVNDEAFFLFMFTRLEDRISTLSTNIIKQKNSSVKNWESKRPWEVLHKRIDNIKLLDKVALLTPLGMTDYKLIELYYKQRNNIAHGGTFTTTVNIPSVIADMKRLYKSLKK